MYQKTYNHELAHQQISLYHGCNEGELDINLLGRSSFKCVDRTNQTNEQYLQEVYLHSLNEIESYNKIDYSSILILLLGCYVFTKQ